MSTSYEIKPVGDQQSVACDIYENGSLEPLVIDPSSLEGSELLTTIFSLSSTTTGIEKTHVRQEEKFYADEVSLIERIKHEGYLIAVQSTQQGTPDDTSPPWKILQTRKKIVVCGKRCHELVRVVNPENAEVIGTENGVAYGSTGIWVSDELINKLNSKLSDEQSDIRRLSHIPVRRCFVYFDVSDFSTYSSTHQALIINSLSHFIGSKTEWTSTADEAVFKRIENRLCLGDGYIICFKYAITGAFFASRLAAKIENAIAEQSIPIEFHFRIGAHVGEVFWFYDVGRDSFNYIGDGINGGNRVLGAIGKDADDLVFVSWHVRDEIRRSTHDAAHQLIESMLTRGRRKDKHGGMWRVFELNHNLIKPHGLYMYFP